MEHAEAPKEQKWRYAVIPIIGGGWQEERRILNEMGDMGYELVCIHRPLVGLTKAYFKRPQP